MSQRRFLSLLFADEGGFIELRALPAAPRARTFIRPGEWEALARFINEFILCLVGLVLSPAHAPTPFPSRTDSPRFPGRGSRIPAAAAPAGIPEGAQ